MTPDENCINERLLTLETEFKNFKNVKEQKVKKEKKEKKENKEKREPTVYNKFVSSYISEQKELLGDDFQHKVAFSGAAKKWTEKKNNDSMNTK